MLYHFVFKDFQLQYCYYIIEIIIVKFELNYHIIFSQNDNIGIWGYYIVISITAHQCVFKRKVFISTMLVYAYAYKTRQFNKRVDKLLRSIANRTV